MLTSQRTEQKGMPKSYLHQQKLKFFTLFQYDELIIKSFFSSENIEACLKKNNNQPSPSVFVCYGYVILTLLLLMYEGLAVTYHSSLEQSFTEEAAITFILQVAEAEEAKFISMQQNQETDPHCQPSPILRKLKYNVVLIVLNTTAKRLESRISLH